MTKILLFMLVCQEKRSFPGHVEMRFPAFKALTYGSIEQCSVPLPQGVENPGMVVGRGYRYGLQGIADGPPEQAHYRPADPDKQGIARAFDDPEMEREVVVPRDGPVTRLFSKTIEYGFEVRDIMVRHSVHGLLVERGLDDPAQLHDMIDGRAFEENLVGEGFEKTILGRPAYEGSLAMPDFEDADGLEHFDGLAYARFTHTQPPREFRLGRQKIAGTHLAFGDESR
jgi:hypothetical protein